jgi:hypothetical protein
VEDDCEWKLRECEGETGRVEDTEAVEGAPSLCIRSSCASMAAVALTGDEELAAVEVLLRPAEDGE